MIAARQINAAHYFIDTETFEKHGAGPAPAYDASEGKLAKKEDEQVPRKLMDVSDAWLKRFQTAIPAAIDTLTGLEFQIVSSETEGKIDPCDLLQQIYSQIVDLRRSLEAVRLIF